MEVTPDLENLWVSSWEQVTSICRQGRLIWKWIEIIHAKKWTFHEDSCERVTAWVHAHLSARGGDTMIRASPPPPVSKRVWSCLPKAIQRREKTKRTGSQCRVTGKEQLDLEGMGSLGAGTTRTRTVYICYLHFMTKWNSFVTPNRKPRYQVHIFILKISRL